MFHLFSNMLCPLFELVFSNDGGKYANTNLLGWTFSSPNFICVNYVFPLKTIKSYVRNVVYLILQKCFPFFTICSHGVLINLHLVPQNEKLITLFFCWNLALTSASRLTFFSADALRLKVQCGSSYRICRVHSRTALTPHLSVCGHPAQARSWSGSVQLGLSPDQSPWPRHRKTHPQPCCQDLANNSYYCD